jgi:hypothetical protein
MGGVAYQHRRRERKADDGTAHGWHPQHGDADPPTAPLSAGTPPPARTSTNPCPDPLTIKAKTEKETKIWRPKPGRWRRKVKKQLRTNTSHHRTALPHSWVPPSNSGTVGKMTTPTQK